MTGPTKQRRRLMGLATLFIVLTIGLLIFITSQAPPKSALPVAASPKPKVALITSVYHGLPARLKIPTLNIDTAVEYMGKTSSGDMAVPMGAIDVGWYKYGAIPGDEGSAVIAGHVVGSRGEAGIFTNLDKLKPGDVFLVSDAKNRDISFTVRELKSYGQTQQPTEVFNSNSGVHLNLITCSGDWDAVNQHYLERLVVFADMTP